MNGQTLTDLLRREPRARSIWRGVFSRDDVPRRATYPSAYIFNTHPRLREGEHWVAVYMDRDRKGEYFDSYGFPPYCKEFRAFLERNSRKWRYNSKTVQGLLATSCGHFCVYYLVHRLRGYTMRQILARFGTDTRKNDSLVRRFVATLKKKESLTTKEKRMS